LFEELVPDDGFIAVNMDGAGAERVAEAAATRKLRCVGVGRKGDDIRLRSADSLPDGLAIEVIALGEPYELKLPLIGAFQAENALLAAAIVCGAGGSLDLTMKHLESLEGAPGRMQFAVATDCAAAYVDYAHTPDAVARALSSIRPHASGKVIAIIGAGGDRDRAKRPLMGKAASEGADIVIVTDDNPRTEDPASIRSAIMAGCRQAVEIGDRENALAEGLSMLEAGDVLLVMGKGHETGQIIGKEVLPFDDAEVLARLVSQERQMLNGDRSYG
jgi:UDP-N-acetylmuramoyl-L-alanyl-D-glutamate--2,6-diaminopimelate ligase